MNWKATYRQGNLDAVINCNDISVTPNVFKEASHNLQSFVPHQLIVELLIAYKPQFQRSIAQETYIYLYFFQ